MLEASSLRLLLRQHIFIKSNNFVSQQHQCAGLSKVDDDHNRGFFLWVVCSCEEHFTAIFYFPSCAACDRNPMSLQHQQLFSSQPRSTSHSLNKKFFYYWRIKLYWYLKSNQVRKNFIKTFLYMNASCISSFCGPLKGRLFVCSCNSLCFRPALKLSELMA